MPFDEGRITADALRSLTDTYNDRLLPVHASHVVHSTAGQHRHRSHSIAASHAATSWLNNGVTAFGSNADPAFLAAKLSRVREPQVAPLNDLADEIADARGIPHSHVPYVDPDSGGIYAPVMVMLDNPSTKAEAGTGSGLLSIDNDDRTARNLREAYLCHGVPLQQVVPWNAVPFPIAGLKNGGSTPAERREGSLWIREFVLRCQNLKYVLLLGAAARDGWVRAGLEKPESLVEWPVPHPSMRGLNSTADARPRFEAAIVKLAKTVNGEPL